MALTRLLAALAVCAMALAACGSSAKPSSTGSADMQAVKYADCMRANGMPNFPDPGSGGALPNPALPAFRAAKKARAKLQPVGLHLGGPPAPTAAELRNALVFAQCMRKHGFSDFPDPLTTYGPGFTLGRGEYFPAIGNGTEVQIPSVQAGSRGLRGTASLGPTTVAVPPANRTDARSRAGRSGARTFAETRFASLAVLQGALRGDLVSADCRGEPFRSDRRQPCRDAFPPGDGEVSA
jgi:hypothetical protein